MSGPLLKVENLTKHYPLGAGFLKNKMPVIRAVEDVSFSVEPGETLCIVGESGCGKSTVARLLMRLMEPTGGRVLVEGTDIAGLKKGALRASRRRMQMVFQDPFSSLNPRLTAGEIITEPVENFERLSRKQRHALAADLLRKVGMSPEMIHRLPSEMSGGQRQRTAIARALALEPSLIIADEAVSALDVSVQAQILNLMMDLQQRMGISFIFISHDLSVVEHIGHRVAVMYLGRIVELAPCGALFAKPVHPYTEALIAAAPVPDPERVRPDVPLEGEVPSPINPPSGCAFHPRCPLAIARCRAEVPPLIPMADGRVVACHVRAPATGAHEHPSAMVDPTLSGEIASIR
ncbi:ABC transporter ATP-binding protein [Rhizobium mongolense]|uniref:ABC transporter ATP-binding protein n=1 Tax=Rhizobium mongolense TaxID=57676 RepID=UPI003555FDC2